MYFFNFRAIQMFSLLLLLFFSAHSALGYHTVGEPVFLNPFCGTIFDEVLAQVLWLRQPIFLTILIH